MSENQEEFSKMSISWYPGHMAKTKKQIIEDLRLIDVVVEILDARIPKSSQNPDLQEWIKNKKKVIILNKSDLSNEKDNNDWLTHYKKNRINAALVDSNSGKGIREAISLIEKIGIENKDASLKKERTGKQIRIMVVGIPNVGKSSFINRITKKTSANVGNKPGITKQKQWINVKDSNIVLMDTPGILWPKLDKEGTSLNLAFVGTIKDEILSKLDIAYYLLKYLLKNNIENLIQRYELDIENIQDILNNKENMENENIMQIMNIIGRKRGAIIRGNRVDEEKTANLLLDDFRNGKLGRITLEKVDNN